MVSDYQIVMNCDARGSELRGFGDDLWKLGLLRYSYSTRGTVHVERLREREARVAEALGTPAAGLCSRPAREKVFLLISCLIRLIHLLSLNREDYLTPKQVLDLIPKPNPNGPPGPLDS
jgi:hypothetical protein